MLHHKMFLAPDNKAPTKTHMNMSREEAYKILGVSEGTSMDDVKTAYTHIALANHPNQKHVSDESSVAFQNACYAYKRLQQKKSEDSVSVKNIMEIFQSVFRFRMKTDSGYVYFMYNPYTGLPESDDEAPSSVKPKRSNRKVECAYKWNSDTKNIVNVDDHEFEAMQEKANKCAEELINEEDKAKKKAAKRREKKLRQREKKRLAKETNQFENDDEENDKYSMQLIKDHQEHLMNGDSVFHDKHGGDKVTNDKERKGKIKMKKNSSSEETSTLSKSNSKTNDNKVIVSNKSKGKINGSEAKHSNPESHEVSRKKTITLNGLPSTSRKVKTRELNKKIQAIEEDESTEPEESESSESDEPGWDEESAFFAKVLKNTKVKVKSTSKAVERNEGHVPEEKSVSSTKQEDALSRSRQLAMLGNKKAGDGDYNNAVILFTKAISILNTDCRYFGNRSYCYDRLELYDRALEDANTAVSLSSGWAKGYFRKGRALAGLKRFIEAEKTFEDVLKLDKHCADAEQELHVVRLQHLLDMGFAEDLCEVALRKKGTIRLALDELLTGVLAETSLKDVYISDDEDAELMEAELNKTKKEEEDGEDNFNEIDFNSLWVGNMTKRVTEEALFEYFNQFGEVCGVTMMYIRRCAFINFTTTHAAKQALLAGDNIIICETQLVVRYPNRAFSQVASGTQLAKRQQRECIYWRNRGCHFGAKCRYVHIPAHKGVELQTVARNPYQSVMNTL